MHTILGVSMKKFDQHSYSRLITHSLWQELDYFWCFCLILLTKCYIIYVCVTFSWNCTIFTILLQALCSVSSKPVLLKYNEKRLGYLMTHAYLCPDYLITQVQQCCKTLPDWDSFGRGTSSLFGLSVWASPSLFGAVLGLISSFLLGGDVNIAPPIKPNTMNEGLLTAKYFDIKGIV